MRTSRSLLSKSQDMYNVNCLRIVNVESLGPLFKTIAAASTLERCTNEDKPSLNQTPEDGHLQICQNLDLRITKEGTVPVATAHTPLPTNKLVAWIPLLRVLCTSDHDAHLPVSPQNSKLETYKLKPVPGCPTSLDLGTVAGCCPVSSSLASLVFGLSDSAFEPNVIVLYTQSIYITVGCQDVLFVPIVTIRPIGKDRVLIAKPYTADVTNRTDRDTLQIHKSWGLDKPVPSAGFVGVYSNRDIFEASLLETQRKAITFYIRDSSGRYLGFKKVHRRAKCRLPARKKRMNARAEFAEHVPPHLRGGPSTRSMLSTIDMTASATVPTTGANPEPGEDSEPRAYSSSDLSSSDSSSDSETSASSTDDTPRARCSSMYPGGPPRNRHVRPF